MLAFSAIRNNDKVGLLLFSDHVELFIPPKKGRIHILRLIREILFFEPTGTRDEPGAGAGLPEPGDHAARGGFPDLGFPGGGFSTATGGDVAAA